MNLKKRDLIICLIGIIMILIFGLNVISNASSSITYNWGDNNTNSNSIINQISLTNTSSTNNSEGNISTENTNNTTRTNNATTTNNNSVSMPNTGLEDLPWVVIAICGISAVFAYKKIKEYNID